jgi:hypothetical protein
MDNPGNFNLGDRAISGALTDEVITSGVDAAGAAREYIGNLEGMLSATIQARFTYGAGGTTCRLMIDTSYDQGLTWCEVARFAFTTANARKAVNLSGLTPVTTHYDASAALSDDTVKDGLLGDRLRARVTSTGSYTGDTSVSVRLIAR